jgi:hydrogenase maturation protease
LNSEQADVVVIALGARHRGDDAVGPQVAAALRDGHPPCHIVEGCDDTLALLNAWDTAALAIVVDAAVSGAVPGTIHRLDGGTAPQVKDLSRCSSHGLGLAEAMQLGRVLDRLPARLIVFAIEAKSFELGTGLSQEVAATVPVLVHEIARELDAFRHGDRRHCHA